MASEVGEERLAVAVEALAGEPGAHGGDVVVQQVEAVRVADQVDRLGEVDQPQPVPPPQHVVRREVGVDDAGLGQLPDVVDELVARLLQRRVVEPGVDEPRRRHAVVAEQLHQQPVAGELHRVGHGDPGVVGGDQRLELLGRPAVGEDALAEVGHALDGPLLAAVPELAALVVHGVVGEAAGAGEAHRLELALADLGGPVALVGEERRAAAVERAALDDEHLGLLAGLEQPEDLVLGVACGEPRRCGALGLVLEHGWSLHGSAKRSGLGEATNGSQGTAPGAISGERSAGGAAPEPSGPAAVAVMYRHSLPARAPSHSGRNSSCQSARSALVSRPLCRRRRRRLG